MNYWEDRVFQREKEVFEATEEIILKVKESYFRSKEKIKGEIEKLKYKLDDLKMFKLDDIEAYNFRINTLQELEKFIYNEFINLSNKEVKISSNYYSNIVSKSFNDLSSDLQKQIGTSFNILPTDTLKDILSTKWLGDNYSSRIWKNTSILASELSNILLDGLSSGSSIIEMSKFVDNKFKTGIFNSERLIRTEVNYFQNQSHLKVYEQYGIAQYKYLAIIDDRTSKLCEELHGKIYDIPNAKVGENYPPMHPFCRSTTVAVFGEDILQDMEDRGIIKRRISGVECGLPMSFKKADTGHVNPDYSKHYGYEINCQSCVPTFEARLRGYNVKAKSNIKGSMAAKLSRQTNLVWIDPLTNENPKYIFNDLCTTPKKYLEFIKGTIKKNERYSIEFAWKGRGNSGHIVNIDLNENGILRIKDNQRGLEEVSEWVGDNEVLGYLSRMKYTRNVYGTKYSTVPRLLRIDNMEFDFDVANQIMEDAIK